LHATLELPVPKSDHEKDKIRQQTEARRRADKDRSAHEAKRGKKVQTLAELSREYPTEDELINYNELAANETDRGAAIMAGALVENALTLAVQARLASPDPTSVASWFEGANAPFATFSAKIKLGRALAIYGEHMESRLNLIKDIRNAFAHASRPLDFSHQALGAPCQKLVPGKHKEKLPRAQFAAACMVMATMLINNAMKHGGKETTLDFP
jgi:hypothetical protein